MNNSDVFDKYLETIIHDYEIKVGVKLTDKEKEIFKSGFYFRFIDNVKSEYVN